jgi:shikimate dehydrogenase
MHIEHLDGETTLYAIVGDPIAAVRSPQYFNGYFVRRGVNAVLLPCHVDAAGLAAFWRGMTAVRNLAGLVVTMPHKRAAAGLVDTLTPEALRVGAINVARREPDGRWHGDMLDGRGFVDGLRRQGHEPRGRRVGLLGVGGAGAAIAFALAAEGASTLAIGDLDAERRETIASRIAECFPQVHVIDADALPRELDLLINATPLGMQAGDALPFDPARWPETVLVADVIARPEMTPLLRRADETGHRVHSGRHMHAGQAACAARFLGFDDDPRDPLPM